MMLAPEVPQWLASGTAPQWGVFVVVLLALIRMSLPWRKLHIDAATQIRSELQARVKELKQDCKDCHHEVAVVRAEADKAIQECRADCDKQTDALKEALLQRDRQRIQEQISTISAIINAVGDNPQLKTLLKTFESVQVAMKQNVIQTQVGSVIPTEKDEPDER